MHETPCRTSLVRNAAAGGVLAARELLPFCEVNVRPALFVSRLVRFRSTSLPPVTIPACFRVKALVLLCIPRVPGIFPPHRSSDVDRKRTRLLTKRAGLTFTSRKGGSIRASRTPPAAASRSREVWRGVSWQGKFSHGWTPMNTDYREAKPKG